MSTWAHLPLGCALALTSWRDVCHATSLRGAGDEVREQSLAFKRNEMGKSRAGAVRLPAGEGGGVAAGQRPAVDLG